MLRYFRTHLAWKLFLSYLIIVLVGVVVLLTATSLSVPSAFDRHLAGMSAMMNGGMMDQTQPIENELFTSYKSAVTEAVTFAAAASIIAALIASFLISRQVVEPVQRMMAISRRIADGEYQERLNISGNLQSNHLDELDQLALTFNQMTDKLVRLKPCAVN
jgi:histidine kinase